MQQANIDQLGAWRAQGNTGDLPVGWQASSSSGGASNIGLGGQNPIELAKQTMALQQEANKPAVASLQAQIPEIGQKYGLARSQLQAQQPTLEQQYSNLLDEIKGKQTADVNAQTRITSGELGKRGIVGSSTLAGQEIQNAVQPINTQYAGLANKTGLERTRSLQDLQNSIANLTPQEIADQRAIANAVAQLQSGGASQGISQGLGLYSTNLAQSNADRTFAEQQKQNQIANALAELQAKAKTSYQTIGEGGSIYDPATGRIIATAPKTYKDVRSSVNDPLGLGF